MTGGRGLGRAAIRVVVADDQELVRGGFAMILEPPGIQVVGEAGDGRGHRGRGARPGCGADGHPHAAYERHRGDGGDSGRRPRAGCSCSPRSTRTSTSTRPARGGERLPAEGRAPADLVHAVQVVASGESLLRLGSHPAPDEHMVERPPRQLPPTGLACPCARPRWPCAARPRALEREIGRELFVSEATVKTPCRDCSTKLGLRDRVQMAVIAYESGLVRPGSDPAG